jgi:serine/threonine protein phosphatase PrpC
VKVVLLRGRESCEIGATLCHGDARAAVGLSIGGAPKRYAHTDPNEDAVLLAEGPAGLLVAVADGHGGAEGSECALEFLRDGPAVHWTGVEGPGSAWPLAAREALAAANDAVLARQSGRRRARTTLALALVRPAESLLAFASVGDSHVFAAETRRVLELTQPASEGDPPCFLGRERASAASLAARSIAGSRSLAATRAVVLATDGLSERGIGVEDPCAAVSEALAAAAREARGAGARETARRLLETALAAHRRNPSGDNVAVAVVWTGHELREESPLSSLLH